MWETLSLLFYRATVYDWLLVGAALLILLYVAGTWNYDFFSRRGILAERPLFPFIGTTMPIFFGADSFPNFLKRTCKLGRGHSVMGIYELQRPIFLVRDPEMLKIICVKEFDHFMNHRNFISEKTDPLFGKNLFNLKDQRWRDMRTTLSPAFTTSKIKGMFPLVTQCAQQMVEHLNTKYSEDSRNEEHGMETNMKDLFTRMANDVIATVAFGFQCDSLKQPKNEFYETGKTLTTFTLVRQLVFIVYLIVPRIVEALKLTFLNPNATNFLDSLIKEAVKERKQKDIFRPDMLHLLIQAKEGNLKAEKEDQHESENIGSRKKELTDEDITAQAIIFFFAGFETVSTVLCFTSLQVSHHPEVQRRLQQEVDEVWERSNGKPTYEDIQGMKYLDAIINEALRMHPPVIGIDRVCQEDTVLPAMGATPAFTITQGQVVSIPNIGIHYDEELWPDPEKFDPERFSDENKHNIKPFSHLPFGLGPRICIGQRFAMVEVKLALLYLVRNFNLVPSPKTKHPMEYEKGFNMTIKGGFWSYLIPRNAST